MVEDGSEAHVPTWEAVCVLALGAFPALVQQNSGFHLVTSEMEHLQHLKVSECKGPDLLLSDSYSSKENLLLYLEEVYKDAIQMR